MPGECRLLVNDVNILAPEPCGPRFTGDWAGANSRKLMSRVCPEIGDSGFSSTWNGMIRGYLDKFPKIGEGVLIEESAQVIGDVEIGDHSSVWFNSVVRGDVYFIRIGKCSNIQDGCILHVTRDRFATVVGDYVTVAHGVILHGCTVRSHCLVGMGAIVMDQAVIGEGSIVGAGALVTMGLQVPPRSLVLGSPATVVRELTPAEVQGIDRYAQNYLMYKENYLKGKESGP